MSGTRRKGKGEPEEEDLFSSKLAMNLIVTSCLRKATDNSSLIHYRIQNTVANSP